MRFMSQRAAPFRIRSIPRGDLPLDHAIRNYDSVISSGLNTYRNYRLFRSRIFGPLLRRQWNQAHGDEIEGRLLPEAQAIKEAVGIPVLCTGGFQTASVIRQALTDGQCDGVTIARPLVANNDLVKMFEQGAGRPRGAVHLLQQMPGQRDREPVGLLRRKPVRFLRRDGRADPVGV